MISQAKANASSVRAFEQSVSATRDYSFRLEKGKQCLEMLLSVLIKAEKEINDAIKKAERALNNLSAKIARIERQISNLIMTLEQLESKKDKLETRLSHMQENGDPAEKLAVELKISDVESDIRSAQDEMSSFEDRLERANGIYSRLESQVDAMNGVAYSLKEKENSCRNLIDEFATIRQKNMRQGASASDALKKLQKVIDSYLRIKMEFEGAQVYPAVSKPSSNSSNTNINNIDINLRKTTFVQMESVNQEILQVTKSDPFSDNPMHAEHHAGAAPEKRDYESPSRNMDIHIIPKISEYEMQEHGIKLDESGRIALYDGKTFGGAYNTYPERLQITLADNNPMIGCYEGIRGESKFIPSNRTVEGLLVIEILSRYGLNGIIYINAEPDFEVCAEAVVKIPAMTENRENYFDDDGLPVQGNFSQADIQLAEQWNEQKREGKTDWVPRDVLDYRKANRLTWHEKCDTETMVLVPWEINSFFRHSGGCSECKKRDTIIDNGDEFDE